MVTGISEGKERFCSCLEVCGTTCIDFLGAFLHTIDNYVVLVSSTTGILCKITEIHQLVYALVLNLMHLHGQSYNYSHAMHLLNKQPCINACIHKNQHASS